MSGGLPSLPRFAAGIPAVAAAAGDIDGDGLADLVVAGEKTISFLRSTGAGFAPPNIFAGVAHPTAIAIGDFNGDGHNDLAITDASGEVAILLGAGNGDFGAPQYFSVGKNPSSVTIGDFNGDGIADLAVANRDGNSISILLGKGDGTFEAAATVETGTAPSAIVAADFTGRGFIDLATADSGSGTITIFLGAGDGTFERKMQFSAGGAPSQLVTADFDEDGFADLAVLTSGNQTARVFLNDQRGNFKPAGEFAEAAAIAVGDFEGDGHASLMVQASATGFLAVYAGLGDGAFAPGVFYPAENSPMLLTAGEFSGDGDANLAATDAAGTVYVMKGATKRQRVINPRETSVSPAPTVSQPATPVVTQPILPKTPTSGASGTPHTQSVRSAAGQTGISVSLTVSNDVMLQGSIMNFVFEATVSPSTTTGKVTFYDSITPTGLGSVLGYGTILPNGTASFSTGVLAAGRHYVTAYYRGNSPSTSASSSAVLTVVTAYTGNVSGFTAGNTYSQGTATSIYVADFNNDGVADLLVTGGTVSNIYQGNALGGFSLMSSCSTGSNALFAAIGDFDRDGYLDFATSNAGSDSVSVCINNGDGTFKPAVNYSLTGQTSPQGIVAADFNSDGVIDLAVACKSGKAQVVLLTGNGDGTFQVQVGQNLLSGASRLAAADLRGIGVMDLVLASGSTVGYAYGIGDGTFQSVRTLDSFNTLSATSVVVSDFNGDGLPDVAVGYVNSGNNGGAITVTLNHGGVLSSLYSSNLNFSSVVTSMTVADANGDGIPDLIVSSPGGVNVFTGTANGQFSSPTNVASSITSPLFVAAGDFNSDGRTDLAIATLSNFNVFLGGNGGTISVTSCNASDLQNAITTLNATGGGTISLTSNCTYTVTAPVDWWYGPNGFPAIASVITIQGNGATITSSQTAGSNNFRYFFVSGGASSLSPGSLTLNNLTLSGGIAQGGGSGAARFSGGGGAGLGGAIYNQGSLTLNSVTLSQNRANGGSTGPNVNINAGSGGGGLGASSLTTIDDFYPSAGGGFKTSGSLSSATVDVTTGGAFTGTEGGSGTGGTSSYGGNGGTSINGNGSGGGGGFMPGANGGSDATCNFVTNLTSAGWGGGSGVCGNSSPAGGGAFGGGGAGNPGPGAGGGVGGGGGGSLGSQVGFNGGNGGFGGGGGGGSQGGSGGFGAGGGASTGGGNLGGAGGWGAGRGGTLTGNNAQFAQGGGGAGLGGAIFNQKGTLTINSSNFVSNTVQGGSAGRATDGSGGSVGGGYGGAIFNLDGTVTLNTMTYSGNSAPSGGSVFYNLSLNAGNFSSLESSYALLSLQNTTILTGNGDLVNTQVDGRAPVLNNVTNTTATLTPSSWSGTVTYPAAKTFTLTNTGSAGSAYLNASSISVSGNFTVSASCGPIAPVFFACPITVTAPVGTSTGTLTVIGNFGSTPLTASLNVTVQPAPTISWTTAPPSSAVYNSTFLVAASTTSGDTLTYTASGACTITGTTVKMTSGTGTCTVTAADAGNANYGAGSLTGNTSASKINPTVAWTTAPPASAAYHSTFTVAATTNSGDTLTYSVSGGVCTISGTTVTMTSVTGTCMVTAADAGNANYAAGSLTGNTSASKINPTVAWTTAPPASATYHSTFTVAATTNSGDTLTYSVSGGVCTISGTTVTMTSITGTCTVTAADAGNANYTSGMLSSQVTALPTSSVSLSTSWASQADGSSPTFGQALTLTATVTPSTATGNVTFYTGPTPTSAETTVLGTAALSGGTATFSTALLPSGGANLMAYYQGDSNVSPSVSSVVSQVVYAAPETSFGANSVTLTAQTKPTSVIVADFNGDGNPDIAVGNNTSNSVSVFLGDGVGGFGSPTNTSLGGSGTFLLMSGDFNGDGIPDLAVIQRAGGNLLILIGNKDPHTGLGNGTFTVSTPVTGLSTPTGAVVLDYNGDGIPDIALLEENNGSLLVYKGAVVNGTYTLTPANTITNLGSTLFGLAAADFNGDGHPDLVVINDSTIGSSNLEILLGDGKGNFGNGSGSNTPSYTQKFPNSPVAVTIADFDSNGVPDIAAVSSDGTVWVLLGQVSGNAWSVLAQNTYTLVSGPPALTAGGIAVGDFNGDGIPDLVVADGSSGSISVLTGIPNANNQYIGTGQFNSPVVTSLPGSANPTTVAVGGFQGSGAADVVTTNGSSADGVTVVTALAATSTSLYAGSSNPSNYGQTVELQINVFTTGLVNAQTYGNVGATGTVTVMEGTNTIGTAAISSGYGLLAIPSLTPGSHSYTGVFSATSQFAASTSPVFTQNVNRGQVTVSAAAASFTYGGAVPTLSSSYSGFVGGDNSSVVSGTPTFTITNSSNQTVTLSSALPAGTYTITPVITGLSATNYTFSAVTAKLTVNKAVLTVTGTCSSTYGTAGFSQSFSYSGFQNGDTSSVVSGTPAFTFVNSSNQTVTDSATLAAGTYPISGLSGLSATNYTFQAAGALTVNPALLTVAINPVGFTYGGTAPTPIFFFSGFKNGDNASVVSGSPTFTVTNSSNQTATYSSALNAGSYTFTGVTGLSAANYTFHPTGPLTVNKANATFSVIPYSVAYDGNPHTATGTAKGVGGVTLSGLTLTGTTHTNAGTYNSDSWTFTDNTGNYNNAGGSVHDAIAQASQTITVTAPASFPATALYESAITVTATGGASGNPVTIAGSGSCSGSGNSSASITISAGSGNCTITLNQAGNTNYSAAPQVTKIIGAQTAAPGLPANNSGSSFSGEPVTLSVTINPVSGGATPTGSVTFSFVANSTTNYVCAGGSIQTTSCSIPLNNGTASVTTSNLPLGSDGVIATYSGDSDYSAGTTMITDTVTLAGTSLSLQKKPATSTVYGSAVELDVTVGGSGQGTPTGGVTLSFAVPNSSPVVTNNICADGTISASPCAAGNTVTLVNGAASVTNILQLPAGTYAINASYSGDSNFTPAASSSSQTITPFTLTVNGITVGSKYYDGTTTATLNTNGAGLSGLFAWDAGNVTLNVASASGAFSDPNAGATPKQVTISGLSLTGSAAGDYQLPAPQATTTAIINPAQNPVVITASSATVTYGDPAPVILPSYAGFLPNEGPSVLSTPPTCVTTYTSTSNAGSAQTTNCSGAADGNYTFTYVGGVVTINKANATISVTPYALIYDANPHTASGSVIGIGSVSLSGLNLAGTTHTNAGTYNNDTWTFTDSAGNYNNASGTVIDTIAQASQSITVTPFPSSASYESSISVVANGGGSGNPVTISSSGACSGSGSNSASITITTGSGTCMITLNQAGNTNYSAAPTVTGTVAAQMAAPGLPSGSSGNSLYGQPVTLSITVNPVAGGATPTGSVTFSFVVNNTTYYVCTGGTIQPTSCSIALANGTASVTTSILPVGTDSVIATYTGDPDYAGGTTTITNTVTQTGTSVSVTKQPAKSTVYGSAVELDVAVSVPPGESGAGTPTGTVALSFVVPNSNPAVTNYICADGSISASACPAANAVTLVNGAASVTNILQLPAGTYAIIAAYSGDSDFTANSVPASQTVTPFTLTVSGITAANKPYDGTTATALNTSAAALGGVFSWDNGNVTLNTAAASGAFSDANFGTGKNVTISGLSLTGSAAANYVLPTPQATTTANISQVPVTVTASSATVTYGASVPMISPSYSGFVNNESASVLTTPATCTTSYTPTSNASSAQTTSCSGASATNYSFSYTGGTVTVNKASATVTLGNLTATYTGSPISATATTNPAGLTVTLTYNGSSTAPTAVGPYTVVATISDPNYTGSATATLNINAASGGPIDVTSQIKWTTTGFAAARGSNVYTATMTITNIGTTPIAAPLQAVFTNVISGATLANGTGTLSSTPYAGAPYITVPGSTPLAAGSSVNVTIKFTYTGTAPISFVLKVLSGVL